MREVTSDTGAGGKRVSPGMRPLRLSAGKTQSAPTTLLVSALERLPASEFPLLARGLSVLVSQMGLAATPRSMMFEGRNREVIPGRGDPSELHAL